MRPRSTSRHTTFAISLRVLIRPSHCRAALALALTEVVTLASAQIAGGGGNAGLLSQIINWVATNIIGGLIAAGVLFVGCLRCVRPTHTCRRADVRHVARSHRCDGHIRLHSRADVRYRACGRCRAGFPDKCLSDNRAAERTTSRAPNRSRSSTEPYRASCFGSGLAVRARNRSAYDRCDRPARVSRLDPLTIHDNTTGQILAWSGRGHSRGERIAAGRSV